MWRAVLSIIAVALLLFVPLRGETDLDAFLRSVVLSVFPVAVAEVFLWRRFVKHRVRLMPLEIAAIFAAVNLVFAFPLWALIYRNCFPEIVVLHDGCSCGRERQYVAFRDEHGNIEFANHGRCSGYQLKIVVQGDPKHNHDFYDPDYIRDYRITLLQAAMIGPPFVLKPSAGYPPLSSPK